MSDDVGQNTLGGGDGGVNSVNVPETARELARRAAKARWARASREERAAAARWAARARWRGRGGAAYR